MILSNKNSNKEFQRFLFFRKKFFQIDKNFLQSNSIGVKSTGTSASISSFRMLEINLFGTS